MPSNLVRTKTRFKPEKTAVGFSVCVNRGAKVTYMIEPGQNQPDSIASVWQCLTLHAWLPLPTRTQRVKEAMRQGQSM